MSIAFGYLAWRLAAVLETADQSARLVSSPAANWGRVARNDRRNITLDGVRGAKAAAGPTRGRRPTSRFAVSAHGDIHLCRHVDAKGWQSGRGPVLTAPAAESSGAMVRWLRWTAALLAMVGGVFSFDQVSSIARRHRPSSARARIKKDRSFSRSALATGYDARRPSLMRRSKSISGQGAGSGRLTFRRDRIEAQLPLREA